MLVSSFTAAALSWLVDSYPERRPGRDAACAVLSGPDRPKLVTSALLKDWNAEHPTKAFGGIGTDIDDPYGEH